MPPSPSHPRPTAGPSAAAGPTRKQNVACDPCRTKKIRCQRLTRSERCPHCKLKDLECTSEYIDSLQNKDKPVKRPRRNDDEQASGPSRDRDRDRDRGSVPDDRPRGASGSVFSSVPPPQAASRDVRPPFLTARGSHEGSHVAENASRAPAIDHRPSINSTSSSQHRPRSASEKQHDLLRYLFSPHAVTGLELGYNDLSDIQLCKDGQSDIWESLGGRLYDEAPSEAHLAVPDSGLDELAEDLIDVFFSIVHIRFPIQDPATFRERFAAPNTHPLGPLTHANLAVAIAFGARFSDNQIIAADRDEISARERERERGSQRSMSRIVHLLVVRAREVCEVRKIQRIVSVENCQALIMLEPLLGQGTFLQEKYEAYHAAAATAHATTLGLMSADSLISIEDPTARQSAVFMWWLTGLSDGWRAVFNRLKPFLNDDDFDVEPPSFMLPPSESAEQTNGMPDSENPTILWFAASNAGCYICRRLCAGLWTPRVRRSGITTATLRDFVHANSQWRDKYIAKLGVPSRWPEQWDFLAAISSCSTDAYFHCLWMIVHRAIGEFGLRDEVEAGAGAGAGVEAKATGMNRVELDSLKRRIQDEAEHGARRIVALVGVLTENGYLRLDPLILYYPIYLAGLVLAEMGDTAYAECVTGLKQYSISFGHLYDLAEEIEQTYAARWKPGAGPGSGSLSQLLAPVGHMGPMGPWGLDGGPEAARAQMMHAGHAHVHAHATGAGAGGRTHQGQGGHASVMGPGPLPGPPSHQSSGLGSGSGSHFGIGMGMGLGAGLGPGSQARSDYVGAQQVRREVREEWHVMGAGAVLAANGFTALPMTPGSTEGMPAAPTKDTSAALFQWLQQNPSSGRQ